ncbi:hypothetical protein BGX34_003159, partial [Mortierella sp. NVP85]
MECRRVRAVERQRGAGLARGDKHSIRARSKALGRASAVGATDIDEINAAGGASYWIGSLTHCVKLKNSELSLKQIEEYEADMKAKETKTEALESDLKIALDDLATWRKSLTLNIKNVQDVKDDTIGIKEASGPQNVK